MMDGMYEPQRQFTAEDMQRYAEMNNHQEAMMQYMNQGVNDHNGIMDNGMGDVVPREKMQHRRRNPHHSMSMDGSRPIVGSDPRRASMLEFGSGSDAGLDAYQFNPGSLPSNGMQRPGNLAQRRMDSHRLRRHMSQEDLALNTSYSNMPAFDMANASPYGHAIHSADAMSGVDLQNDYNMLLGMDFTSTPIDQMNRDHPHDHYPQSNLQNPVTPALHRSASHGLPTSIPSKTHDPGGGLDERNMQRQDQSMPPPEPIAASDPGMSLNPQDMAMQTAPTYPNQTNIPLDASDVKSFPQNPNQKVVPQYRNAYSSSGFDMLGVLMRVAARPNPQINLGAVDMSCAFVVCDVTSHDIPIVYCSDVFERLTAYTRHEILGRNCRFLQSPDGKIQSGVKRKYVDDKSVLRIKNLIAQRQEAQVSLINYRKGGQPFMNLLTMIPITWDDPNEIKYYVGFQVDLVEQPTSITNKNPDGTYSINYQRGLLPRYVIPEANKEQNPEAGQTVHRDDVSTVLSTIGSGESELSKRIWDKVLLENTDDVVHVLSLKGLFLYLSPSSRKILEYDPSELVGTPLSSVCHPSDIVPVTRELKDTSTGAAVNVVFRIRRKHNGYTWFESHGSLHLEQGKGRKCIIMVGRERPVYALARADVMLNGGFGESELWTKMSTSGMFLFISSNVRSLLDRQPEDLIGTSAQALMRQDSKLEFGQKLEMARSGVRCTLKHDVENKRGQTLQAQTTLYPGDATEGQKPTFLVAQTRLLKLSRHKSSAASSAAPIEAKSTSPASSSGAPAPSSTTQPMNSVITTQAGGSGLLIGNQHEALASEDNVFDELKTTRSTSWQFELRQMEKRNRLLAEELQGLLSSKKKRKRRNGPGNTQKDCANCHTRVTPEWRRGPSGNRDLCNSCGLRWAKENGRITPRTSSNKSSSPVRTNSDGKSKQFGNSTSPRNNVTSSPDLRSPQNIMADSHTAKTSRMEAPAVPGYGGGIPAKIEEGVEM